ncbi:MAG: HEAT repeat domain-containing protein, partial [Planctomycetaceae bacterium]|nr:HEAT repeat domain-containing protein [Planctomycetaceae bacterium]
MCREQINIVVLFLATTTARLVAQDIGEPEYEGRRLSSWVAELSDGRHDHFSYYWSDQPDEAFEAFNNMGSLAVPALNNALKDESAVVRRNAAEGLRQIGPEARDATPALIIALDDPDLQVRLHAVYALGAIGVEATNAIPRLAEILDDTEEHTVAPHGFWRMSDRARDALVSIGPEAIPAFQSRCDDKDDIVKLVSIEALCELDGDNGQIVAMLIEDLEDKAPIVRAVAAQRLGNLGPNAKQALRHLARHLDDKGEYTVGTWYSSHVGFDVLNAIQSIGPAKGQIPELIQCMQATIHPVADGRSFHVRRAAVEMLGDLGQEAALAIPVLKEALNDDELRVVAAASLLRIDPGDEQARSILLNGAQSEEPGDCFVTLTTISHLNWADEECVALLRSALKKDEVEQHDADITRLIAACILLRIQETSEEALKVFRECIDTENDTLWLYEEVQDESWQEVLKTIHEVRPAAKAFIPIIATRLEWGFAEPRELAAITAMGPYAADLVLDLRERLKDETKEKKRVVAVMAIGC